MSKIATAQKQFLEWLKKYDPFLYATVDKAAKLKAAKNQGLNGLGFSIGDLGDFFKTAVNTVKDVAPQIIQTVQQKKIIDAQIKRAQQGLPPLDTAQYTATVPYNPANAQQQQLVNSLATQSVETGSNSFMRFLPWLAAGGLAAYLYGSRKRG